MALLEKLSILYCSISLRFRHFLLRILLLFKAFIYRTSPRANTTRTALILGDAHAVGIGDTIGSLGLVTRISKLIREERETTNLRLYWHVVTAGKLYSKAYDWAPGSRLFERALIYGPYSHADVVVLLLGVHDDVANDPEIVDQVVRIVEGIIRLGKHAIVSSFPNTYPPKSPEHDRIRAANAKLRDELELLKEENTAPGCGTINVDVEMAKVYAMGDAVTQVENSFIGLNPAGYRLLAREVYDALVPTAKKVEWAYWKDRLSGTTQ